MCQAVRANTLNKFGIFLDNNISRYKEAINLHQQSLEIQREIGDRSGEAASLGNLGNAYDSLGEYQRSIDFHQQSLEIQSEIGNRQDEAASLSNLGSAYRALGEYHQAIDFHQQSLEIYRKIDDRSGEAASLSDLGSTYRALGEYQRAIDFHQQSLEIQREVGDRNGEATSLFNQALALAKYESRSFEAVEQFKQARAIYAELKLDKDVEDCDKAIYYFERIIVTEQRQSAPTIGNPLSPEK